MKRKNLITWKKWMAVVLAGVMTAAVLTGCGSTDETSADTTNTETETSEAETSETEEGVTTVTIGVPGLYALQNFVNEEGELDGAEIDVLKEIDERLPQYEFEYSTMDFASLLPALDAGKVDVACSNLRRNDAREEAYIHTYRAYITSPYSIIVLDSDTEVNGIEDLEGKTIGINEGSMQATIFEEYIAATGADITLLYSSDPVPDLVSGRVAAIIDPARYALSLNESYEDAQFKVVGEPIDSLANDGSLAQDSNVYFWFAQSDTELRDAFSEVLEDLYEEGFLAEVSEKWYGEDYASSINKDIEAQIMEEYGITE